jgi:hypothetical protein
MDRTTSFIVLELPLLLLSAGLVGTAAWHSNGTAATVLGKASPVATRLLATAGLLALWVVLTITSVWLALLYGMFVCHMLLFWLGRLAAGAALTLLGLVVVAIPFAWGWALFRPGVRH